MRTRALYCMAGAGWAQRRQRHQRGSLAAAGPPDAVAVKGVEQVGALAAEVDYEVVRRVPLLRQGSPKSPMSKIRTNPEAGACGRTPRLGR